MVTGNNDGSADLNAEGLSKHPAWRGRFLGGAPGYSLPELPQLQQIVLDSTAAESLVCYGIKIRGEAIDTRVFIHPEAKCRDLTIWLHGRRDGVIIIDKVSNLFGHIRMEGDNHLCILGRSDRVIHLEAIFRGNAAALLLGSDCSSNGASVLCWGPGVSIQIGDDAMISSHVDVWTCDSHGIISSTDLEKAILNPPNSIEIGPHVWLGKGSMISKGRTIGGGAIIGAGSTVTRDVPSFTAVVGSPAEIKQVDVTWTRAMNPVKSEKLAAIAAVNQGSHNDFIRRSLT